MISYYTTDNTPLCFTCEFFNEKESIKCSIKKNVYKNHYIYSCTNYKFKKIQQEILCPKCKNDMKEYVTRFICRNCKYTYTKIFPPKVEENYK